MLPLTWTRCSGSPGKVAVVIGGTGELCGAMVEGLATKERCAATRKLLISYTTLDAMLGDISR